MVVFLSCGSAVIPLYTRTTCLDPEPANISAPGEIKKVPHSGVRRLGNPMEMWSRTSIRLAEVIVSPHGAV